MKERTSPRVGLSLVWSVALVLSVYGAPHARDEIARSDVPGKRWLGAGVSALSKLGDAIGIAHVRHGIERLRSVVNGPYLILVQPILVQPTDLIVAQPT